MDLSFFNKEWRLVGKQCYTIHVYRSPLGVVIHNELEDSDYITDERKSLVMIGLVGERWVIDEQALLRAYHITKEEIDALCELPYPVTTRPRSELLYATKIPLSLQFSVTASYGEVLKVNRDGVCHGDGDWLLCAIKDDAPDLSDVRVVNGMVFPKIYAFVEA